LPAEIGEALSAVPCAIAGGARLPLACPVWPTEAAHSVARIKPPCYGENQTLSRLHRLLCLGGRLCRHPMSRARAYMEILRFGSRDNGLTCEKRGSAGRVVQRAIRSKMAGAGRGRMLLGLLCRRGTLTRCRASRHSHGCSRAVSTCRLVNCMQRLASKRPN
jgi:hypothetical protein